MSTRPFSEAEVDRLVLTVAEAADRLGISSDLAYDLVARGGSRRSDSAGGSSFPESPCWSSSNRPPAQEIDRGLGAVGR